jgi:general secretion pathway protein G
MILPDRLLKRPRRVREQAKARIRRESERAMRKLGLGPRIPGGRRPSTLLIVMAVMTVLGALLVGRTNTKFPKFDRVQKTSGERVAKEVRALRVAVERFRQDCGRYPSEREGLRALVRKSSRSGWNGPYITLLKPDPWGTDYVYTLKADGGADVRSAGPDAVAETADDIVAAVPSADEISR